MTHLADFLDLDNLALMISEGLIAKKESDDGRVLYDYSQKVQFSGAWNPETRACRGLVTDMEGHLLARPFPKFHNLAEHDNPSLPRVPIEPFEVFDKLDGSLIIAYPWQGTTIVNTRGSFSSTQAAAAQAWLNETHPDLQIPEGQTWLFEWIAPDNRIVVDYSGRREMVLLAVVDNATGQDLPLPCLGEWSGSRVDRFDFDSLEAIALAERDDAEGYVIRFRSGMRVKIKGAEYVRLHRILTGVSARTIWECLSKGDSLDKMLDRVPDEFYQWVHKVACGLAAAYRLVEDSAAKDLEALHSLRDDRKAFASEAIKSKYRGILFAMLDGKDYSRIIWKDLKPAADRPFVEDEA